MGIEKMLSEVGKEIAKSINQSYDRNIQLFGKPIRPNTFNRNEPIILSQLSKEEIIELVQTEPSGITVAFEDFMEFAKNDLLPISENKEGELVMPLFGFHRVGFLKKLIDKWGYDNKKLKDITSWEDHNVDMIYTSNALAYDDADDLTYYISYLKGYIDHLIFQNKVLKSFNEKEKNRKKIRELRKQIGKWRGKTFRNLNHTQREAVSRPAYRFRCLDEEVRIMSVNRDRAIILLGFSPEVTTIRSGGGWGGLPKGYGYKEIKKMINNLDGKDSPYIYIDTTNNEYFYCYEWEPSSMECSFFSTPEFMLEMKDNGKINIEIREPGKVDARYMRRIEKVYNAFRDKQINPTKSSWGEKSGIKKKLKERDQVLRERYIALRKSFPSKSAERQLERIVDEVSSQYGRISIERAKRIIYTKG